MRVLLLLGGTAGLLLVVIGWLVRYSTGRNRNSAPDWWSWSWAAPAPDSTVTAYARQVHEHAELNDQTATWLASQVKTDEPMPKVETITLTEQPPPL